MDQIISTTMDNLRKNGFEAIYFDRLEEVNTYLTGKIDPKKSVGFGGSWTVKELGIFEELKKRGNPVYWHWFPENQDKKEILYKAMQSDIYLSGANGITLDGRIINIDGTGNRLSGLLFGHERVYLIAGKNKISKNLEEAFLRIKNEACPQNAKRLGLNTPCAVLGKCTNCSSPQRMCNATLVLDRQPGGVPITVILAGEIIGF